MPYTRRRGRNASARTSSVARRHSRLHTHAQVPPDQREAWYERELRTECKCAWLTLASFLLDGLALGTLHLFRADGLFDLHFAPGEPPLVADRTALQRRRALPDLQRDHADVLPAVDGKKLLVSLAMEGKFSNEGLQGIEDDDDVLTAMARELVTKGAWGSRRPPFGRLFKSSTLGYCRPLRSRRRSERNWSPDHSTKWSQSMAQLRPWFLGAARKGVASTKAPRRRTGLSTLAVLRSTRTQRNARRHFQWRALNKGEVSPWNCFPWN